MNKLIISYKHSLGPYFNLITSINDKGLVEYEYSYCTNFIYNPNNKEYNKDSLNKELSKQFIEYIDNAQIEEMEEAYFRSEQVIDNAPDCWLTLLKDSDSTHVYIEADAYPDKFKYIIKALNLINEDFTYWYKYVEAETMN